jgi:Uma2 family endonuclease
MAATNMPLAQAQISSLYSRLEALPEGLVGEIIAGELHTQPRPAGPHALSESVLGMDIGSAYQRGRGGPGGWWIIDEPELHFVRDTEVLVPDIAGWRRERMPQIPKDHRFEVTPDWVCEVLSPNTARKDRVLKMPVYARYGVAWLWLVDPLLLTLEVYRLENDHWVVDGLFKEDAKVRSQPFPELDLHLADLWTPA